MLEGQGPFERSRREEDRTRAPAESEALDTEARNQVVRRFAGRSGRAPLP